jgi:hypothetical protein
LRRAKDTADFFDAMAADEQQEWADELADRVVDAAQHADCPYVTLMDTGVNNAHPLLASFVADADLHTLEPAWLVDDHNGHGTELAGLALLGDLTPALADDGDLLVGHRLESVKILEQPGGNQGESYGDLTSEAVARVEVTAIGRRRIFSMSVTATDGRDRGRPSSWSSAIDRLAADFDDEGAAPRLFLLSAGNTPDNHAWANYPASLATNSAHDPAQAWNAITVGAYSQLTNITEPDTDDFEPVAPVDGLSPFTTTSTTWPRDWPLQTRHRDGGWQRGHRLRRVCLHDAQPFTADHGSSAAGQEFYDLARHQCRHGASLEIGCRNLGGLSDSVARDCARPPGPLGALDITHA